MLDLRHLALLSPLVLLTLASPAHAQGVMDLDSDAKAKRSKTEARPDVVREIRKGGFAKANVGGAIYLGDLAGAVFPGTAMGLSVGTDFIDQASSSMAFEAMFVQGIHNGCAYQTQVSGECRGAPGPFVQGDLRTYTLAAVLEWSYYPTRRLGLGLRGGGGMMFSPLLMDDTWYRNEVLPLYTSGGNPEPTYHTDAHPVVMGGPTIEYYTKLSHFSVGIDVDVLYALGFDLGLNATGALKYTF